MNTKLLEQILTHKRVTCLHILGQDLCDQLVEIILKQNEELQELREYKEDIENSDIPGEDN